MPFGLKPSCASCKASSSTIWKKDTQGDIICYNCSSSNGGNNGNGKDGSDNGNGDGEGKGNGNGRGSAVGSHFVGSIRKSARLKPSKYRYQPTTRAIATKGKSRRVIFKKHIIKAPTAVASVVTSDYVFHNGQYFQVGDVVSLMDHDGGIFYAQIRGFIQDQYMEKSVVLTWLLPTTSSPAEGFDPATFVIGPEEDLPRKLDCMEYVCHAPTEYFRAKTAPYPTTTAGPELGYVWTSLGYEIVRSPSYDEIFGLAKPVPEPKERQPREKREPKDKSEPKEKKEGKEKKDSIKDKTQLKEKEIKKEPKVAEKRVNKR